MSEPHPMHSSAAADRHGLLSVPRLIIHLIRVRRAHRQLRRQLMGLDDHLLRDIGLTRATLKEDVGEFPDISRRRR